MTADEITLVELKLLWFIVLSSASAKNLAE